MKMNFYYIISAVTAMLMIGSVSGCVGDEGLQPDDPTGEPELPTENTFTLKLDFTSAWPFDQPCSAVDKQSNEGESYTYESDKAFKLGFIDKNADRSYSWAASSAEGKKALCFASTSGLINLPGIEGMYLKQVTVEHYSGGSRRFAIRDNFGESGGNRLLLGYQASGAATRFTFPVEGASLGTMESEAGKSYCLEVRDANTKICEIILVYSDIKPAASLNGGADMSGIHLFAHRGKWRKGTDSYVIPENSIHAAREAARLGFEGIECDVKYTKDRKMVIMHDATLNKTMRNRADYSELSEDVKVADLTLEELRNNYVLESTVKEFRLPAPTLEELLNECKALGLRPMLHSSIYESYELAQRIMGDDWVAFDSDYDVLLKARQELDSKCTVLWSTSSGTSDEIKSKLQQLGGDCGISSMTHSLYTPELVSELREAGYHVQCSIFPQGEELIAMENGVDYVLSDRILPEGSQDKGSILDEAGKSIKIFGIGNSYTMDAMTYLYNVLEAAGYNEIDLGYLYIGGCSLEQHATNFTTDAPSYRYYKNFNGSWSYVAETKPLTALADNDWDYITIQETHGLEAIPASYDPHLDNLVGIVKSKCPQAELVWYMTWAYAKNYKHERFEAFDNDQMKLYEAIVSTVQERILTDDDFVKVIPAGTAVQNMRTSFVGDNLNRDGYHLSYEIGRPLASLTFAKILTGCDLDEIHYRPSDYTYSNELNMAMNEAVNNACAKPYEVTKSSYPPQYENLPEDFTITLDFTKGWPFSTPIAQVQAKGGETYHYTLPAGDGNLSIPVVIDGNGSPYSMGEGYITLGDNGAGIKAPAFEDRYLTGVKAYKTRLKRFVLPNGAGSPWYTILYDLSLYEDKSLVRYEVENPVGTFISYDDTYDNLTSARNMSYAVKVRDAAANVTKVEFTYSSRSPGKAPAVE